MCVRPTNNQDPNVEHSVTGAYVGTFCFIFSETRVIVKELWEHCLCPTHARTVTTPVMKDKDKVAKLADESCS